MRTKLDQVVEDHEHACSHECGLTLNATMFDGWMGRMPAPDPQRACTGIKQWAAHASRQLCHVKCRTRNEWHGDACQACCASAFSCVQVPVCLESLILFNAAQMAQSLSYFFLGVKPENAKEVRLVQLHVLVSNRRWPCHCQAQWLYGQLPPAVHIVHGNQC